MMIHDIFYLASSSIHSRCWPIFLVPTMGNSRTLSCLEKRDSVFFKK